MTSEIDEFRMSLVAAVQAELERHASAVVAEVDRLRNEGRLERQTLRDEITGQLGALAQSIQQANAHGDTAAERVREAFEQRLTDVETRNARRVDEVTASVEGLVREAVRPLMTDVNDQQAVLERRVEALDTNLRKFDEQAARMVTYFNDVSQQMERRQVELGDALRSDVAARIEALQRLVDENDAAVRRFQTDVGQSVSQKLNDAEDRFNNRMLAAEGRMREESGQKIAEIDAHVGKVAKGLDDTMLVLNERVAALDDRFVEIGRRIDEVEAKVEGVDSTALDEMKEKLSSAVGEAMLVRIEMERLEKGVAGRTDDLAVRMTEVETQLQDATMDVSTAIQLDRLEEIERALLEIDPTKFVLKDETVKNRPEGADASSGSREFETADEPSGADGSWA